jgi:Co/Zn/Cd efflux system component
MDLKNAEKKIRNAWIASLIPAFILLYFDLGQYMQGADVFSLLIVACATVAPLFGLSFGIYKKSRICATLMFICIILLFLFMLYTARQQFHNDNQLTGTGLVVCGFFALIYFTFEGMRGTFAYHKLKNNKGEQNGHQQDI